MALRAAAVTAGNEIVEAAGGVFSTRELGYYLLLLAHKTDGLEGVQPHLTKGTMSY